MKDDRSRSDAWTYFIAILLGFGLPALSLYGIVWLVQHFGGAK